MVYSKFKEFLSILREKGLSETIFKTKRFLYERALSIRYRKTASQNVYDKDWDILIILDGCRIDVLEEVSDEYNFIQSVDSIPSVGVTSKSWLNNTFTEDYSSEIDDTIYITGNPYSNSHIDAEMFSNVFELWRSEWNKEKGTIEPSPITDLAIKTWKEQGVEGKKLILHYMQPHYPFIKSDISDSRMSIENWGQSPSSVWDELAKGVISKDDAWEAYKDNLRYVLDNVENLINSVDCEKVCITADHGNAFGEFGIYGHPEGVYISPVQNVPWVETSASDSSSYEPSSINLPNSEKNEDVTERLEQLGYV